MKPISPLEAQELKLKSIPNEVIEIFNEAIVTFLKNDSSLIYQEYIIEKILESLNIERNKIFERGYLDIESLFENVGWTVHYTQDGSNSNYLFSINKNF